VFNPPTGIFNIVCHAVGHFWILYYVFLRHTLIQKLFTNYSARRHEPSTSLMATARMATARMETSRGPTYSMAT